MKDLLNIPEYLIKFISKMPVLMSISFATAILTFLPSKVMEQMQLVAVRKNIGWIISIIFLFSTIWLIIRFGIWIFKIIFNYFDLKTAEKYLVNDAKIEELKLLLSLFNQPGYTAQLIVDKSAVKGLTYRHVLLKIGSTLQPAYDFSGSYSTAMRLNDWTIRYIKKNKTKMIEKIYQSYKNWIDEELDDEDLKNLRQIFGNSLEKTVTISDMDYSLDDFKQYHVLEEEGSKEMDINTIVYGKRAVVSDWARKYINEKYPLERKGRSSK
ncbi:super-infection exclusion protein B [Lactococcus garvieae]|uniref:super-infection exclusion protein B n=1 Tax=Lactococcus garvieae TaxID=1363 RepID=UPI003250B67C